MQSCSLGNTFCEICSLKPWLSPSAQKLRNDRKKILGVFHMHMWTSPVLLFYLTEHLFMRKRTLAEITMSLQTYLNPLYMSFLVDSVEVRGREQTHQPIKVNSKFRHYNIKGQELRITFSRHFLFIVHFNAFIS